MASTLNGTLFLEVHGATRVFFFQAITRRHFLPFRAATKRYCYFYSFAKESRAVRSELLFCVSLCLSARLHKNNRAEFHEPWWRGGVWVKVQAHIFWGQIWSTFIKTAIKGHWLWCPLSGLLVTDSSADLLFRWFILKSLYAYKMSEKGENDLALWIQKAFFHPISKILAHYHILWLNKVKKSSDFSFVFAWNKRNKN